MVDKMNTGIGPYLRQIRKGKGGKGFWSIPTVAKRAGISNSYLSQLETGQVKQPLPDILKKLAESLRHPYMDLLRAAGYLPPEPEEPKEKPEMLRIPILGECPAGAIKWFGDEDHAEDWVEIPFYLIKDRDVYAVRARGSCLKEVGIMDNDIVIVSKSKQPKNGDIVVVRIDTNEVTMKRFFLKDKIIILEPANDDHEPIIVDPKKTKVEIIGKVIRALKIFD